MDWYNLVRVERPGTGCCEPGNVLCGFNELLAASWSEEVNRFSKLRLIAVGTVVIKGGRHVSSECPEFWESRHLRCFYGIRRVWGGRGGLIKTKQFGGIVLRIAVNVEVCGVFRNAGPRVPSYVASCPRKLLKNLVLLVMVRCALLPCRS